MYKLLIVEDEDLLREALVHSVDWKKLGYDVQAAENGAEALKIAQEFHPDIVLTDIRMPFIDGLQLSAELQKLMPETLIAILSGHDEFAYAQEALKYGVREYIKKPISPDDLIAIIRSLERKVDSIRARATQQERMRKQLAKSIPYMRQKLLNQMVLSSISEDEIIDMLGFVGLHLKGERFTVCLIDCTPALHETVRETAIREFAVVDTIQMEVGTDAVAFELSGGGVALIYCARTSDAERERIYVKELMRAVCTELYSQLDIVAAAAIGTPVDSLSRLNVSYQGACEALQLRLIHGQDNIFDIYDCPDEKVYYPFDEIRQLVTRLKLNSKKSFDAALGRFFSGIVGTGNISEQNLRVLMIDLVSSAHRTALEAGIPLPDNAGDIYKSLFSVNTLEESRSLLSSYLGKLHAGFLEQQTSKSSKIIAQVCEYIKENFADPELSLNSVAAHVYISPTYLSILFKKELNETFIDYLIHQRLEKAKELLCVSNMRTFEVAEAVGYNDPQYFSGCFKKFTGCTPTEYRSRNK